MNKRAFTIMELLVVITIILLLLALVVPVLRGALGSPRDAKCVANMKAWSRFILLYGTAHNGEFPILASNGEPLYAAGQPLKSFFSNNNIPPEVAYCPARPELHDPAQGGGWSSLSWTQSDPDFSNPYVLEDNTDLVVPNPGPVPPFTIDNLTVGTDNYFELTGPAAWSTSTDPSGYHGTNYARIDGVLGVSIPAVVVDNEGPCRRSPPDPLPDNRFVPSGGFTSTWVYAEANKTKYAGHECTTTATATATWHFKIPAPAGLEGHEVQLKVEGWWPGTRSSAYCVTDASFTINHEGGSTSRSVDQKNFNGTNPDTDDWCDLGTYPFKCGQSYSIVLDNQSDAMGGDNKWCYADAVRVRSAITTTTAVWHFKVPVPAGRTAGQAVTLEVEGKWPKSAAYCVEDATFTIQHEGGPTQQVINQQTTTADWYEFGTFTFKCDSSYRVELSNLSANLGFPGADNKHIHADAIKVTDPSAIGDGLPEEGFAVLSTGWTHSEALPAAYPPSPGTPDYVWAARTTTDHKTAVWTFTAPGGTHTIYGWWPSLAGTSYNWDLAEGVPFSVHRRSDGGQIGFTRASQKTGARWMPLATCDLEENGKYYVQVSSAATSGVYSLADAIAIPRPTENKHTVECIGYLYLGYRSDLPNGGVGIPASPTPPKLVSNLQDAGTPILVDWMSDQRTFTNHEGHAHVLTLDGSVRTVYVGDAAHRWTSPEGVKFYW